jgi:hypothetical protein
LINKEWLITFDKTAIGDSALVYQKYVIYQAPMDCYHHVVQVLEHSIPAACDSIMLRDEAWWSIVA